MDKNKGLETIVVWNHRAKEMILKVSFHSIRKVQTSYNNQVQINLSELIKLGHFHSLKSSHLELENINKEEPIIPKATVTVTQLQLVFRACQVRELEEPLS